MSTAHLGLKRNYSLENRKNSHENLGKLNQEFNPNIQRLKTTMRPKSMCGNRKPVLKLEERKYSEGKKEETGKNRPKSATKLRVEGMVDEGVGTSGKQDHPILEVPDQKVQHMSIESSDCPMNNPDLPPVGEMEHFVDRCYCFLCSCGKHICPGLYKKRAAGMSSMYATIYRSEYGRKSVEMSKPMSACSFSLNQLPMDLQTVNMRDYQPYKIESTPTLGAPSPSASVPFIFRTSYQSNYPNWGPASVVRVKQAGLPYRGDQVKLDPKTTYNEDYQLPKAGQQETFHKSSGSRLSTNMGLMGGTEFYGKTTAMSSFRPYTANQMAKREQRPVERDATLMSTQKHFKTTYRADYVPKRPPVRPMKTTKSLVIL